MNQRVTVAAEPIEQLPSMETIVGATIANAEALRDLRVAPADAARAANDCQLALAALPLEATADPRYMPAQCLNMTVIRWVRWMDSEFADDWGEAARAFIRLTRKIQRRIGRG